MEINVNELARNISKLDISEREKLIDVLVNKYGIYADIYPYPVGIISISNENITYDVRLSKTGGRKLQLVKRIKELLDIGLKASKDIMDATPCTFITNISLEEAEKLKEELEFCGATIDIL